MTGSRNHLPVTLTSMANTRHGFLRRHLMIGAAMAGATLITPATAFAQDTTATETAAPTQGDIVVTAQRDKSLASKTPLAITAIGGDALLKEGVTNPLMLANAVPNLELNRYYGLQITIRGVTNSDVTAKGDPSAAFLLDGVYIARPQAQEVSFFDIDRVEVLRGPQGTLYGRNTTAGLINVISNRPTDQFEVIGNIGYGNYNTFQADAAVNVPVNDKIAFRIAGSLDRRDSYIIKAAGDPYKDDPFKDNKSVRLSAKVDVTDNLSLLLVGDYSSIRGISQFNLNGDSFYAPVDGDPSNRRYIADASASARLQRGFSQGMTPHVDDQSYGIMGELSWNLGPVTATYLGSYRKFTMDEATTDLLGMVTPTYTTQRYEQNSHELRLELNNVAGLKLQAGAMYFSERSYQYYDQPNYFGFDHIITDYGPTKSKSYAVFGQGTYSVTDKLRLTAGARFTHDDKSQFGLTYYNSTIFGNSVSVSGTSVAFSKATWRVSADYDLGPRNMIYASVSTGYKAGGFNDGCEEGSVVGGLACNAPRSRQQLFYSPETITSYEAGLKGRIADNSVRYALTGFYYDYNNMQLSGATFYNGVATQLIQNAGKARVKGIEAEVTLLPSPRNQLSIFANYLDAYYTSYLPLGEGGPDFAGKPLDRSPKTSVTANYTYTLPLASGADVALNAQTKLSAAYYLSNFTDAIQYRQPSYTRTEVSVTYNAPGKRWYLQAYARNLENNVLISALTDIAGVLAIVPGDPRTFGARAGFKF